MAGGQRPRRIGIASAAAVALIKAYQRFLSPLLGPQCRFYPTCSQYAVEAFEKHGCLGGMLLTVCRIVRCGPWHPGGVDPVPEEIRLGKLFRGR